MSPYASDDPHAVLATVRKQSPPGVEDIVKQANELPAMSSNEKDKFILGVIEASDPGGATATQKLIRDTVTNLTGLGLQADDALFRLQSRLESAASTVDGNTAQTLREILSRLKQARQNFVRLVWDSRDIARKAEATVRDFGTDFVDYLGDGPAITDRPATGAELQQYKVEIQEKKDEIRNYLRALGKQRESAHNFAQQLLSFPDGLKECSGLYDLDAGARAEEARQQSLRDKVTDINKQIQVVHDAFSKTPWATVDGGAGELLRLLLNGGPAYASLGVVLPVAGHMKAGTGAGLLATHAGALLQLYNEKEAVLMEIDKLLPDANALLGLKIALFTNSERAQDFLKGVYLIPSTWDIIVKELGATTNAWNNKQEPAYLKTSQSIYTALAEILKVYQTVVSLPKE